MLMLAGLSFSALERIFDNTVISSPCGKNQMQYRDFVWFILAEEV